MESTNQDLCWVLVENLPFFVLGFNKAKVFGASTERGVLFWGGKVLTGKFLFKI